MSKSNMSSFGETIYQYDVDEYRLVIVRTKSGGYIVDVQPINEDGSSDDSEGVHISLTRAQLVVLGATIQDELEGRNRVQP